MQPRSLQQIVSELQSTYQPQVQSLQQQQALIPQQVASQEQGLQAKQTDAFGSILDSARQRGLGFSGIPLGEQAKYTASTYLPALAQLRQQGQQQAISLQDAINGVNERRDTFAHQLYQQDQDRSFQAQQAALARKAAASSGAGLAALLRQNGQQQAPTSALNAPGVGFKNSKLGGKGGYTFSFGNNPVSAASYAKLNGLDAADILYSMATAGDTYAANAYKDILGNDGQITPDIMNKYSALFWGEIPQAAPKPQVNHGGLGRVNAQGQRVSIRAMGSR